MSEITQSGDSSAPTENIFELNRTQRLVLDTISIAVAIPRARLAEVCGVSAPAITKIVRELIARKLIVGAGKGSNSRGQPSTNLSLNPEGAFGIGVFVERDGLSTNIVNFAGAVIYSNRLPGMFDDPREAMPTLFQHLNEIIEEHIPDQQRILGLGVAITGNFIVDGRTVVPPDDMKNWQGLDIATQFEGQYSFPIIVENDGSTAALGEKLTGQGLTYKTFFYVHMANGLGGGYILNGRIIRGACGNASELGHLLQEPNIRPTLRNLAKALDKPLGSITLDQIQTMFDKQDKTFFRWLDKAIENLQQPINSIATLMDPEAIVFGGRFPADVIEYIIDKLIVNDYGKRWASVARPALVPARNFSADAAVYGAATLPLYSLIAMRP